MGRNAGRIDLDSVSPIKEQCDFNKSSGRPIPIIGHPLAFDREPRPNGGSLETADKGEFFQPTSARRATALLTFFVA